MDLDLYQAETTRIATKQTAILNQAQQIIESGRELSPLEQNGVLHALQILIEKWGLHLAVPTTVSCGYFSLFDE